MNPSQIKQVLKELGGGANKHLGQHFLIDPMILEAIIETAAIVPGDTVLEIGPGLGVLTRELYNRDASVYAIERDPRYVRYIQTWAEENRIGGVRVLQGDATRLSWASYLPEGAWKFVSNLPYGITSFALRTALWSVLPPSSIVVLIQREVAERIVAQDGKTSLLSLMVGLSSSSARIVQHVPPEAFFPPPKVDSAVLHVVPLNQFEREAQWGIHPDRVMELAKRGFAHPRKVLASNLGLSIEQKSILATIAGSDRVRAEDLSVKQWVQLTISLNAAK